MTPQQFQLALSQCVQQVMQAGQTPPVVVIGILECTKMDLHTTLLEMAKQQSAIVATNRMPENGGGQ